MPQTIKRTASQLKESKIEPAQPKKETPKEKPKSPKNFKPLIIGAVVVILVVLVGVGLYFSYPYWKKWIKRDGSTATTTDNQAQTQETFSAKNQFADYSLAKATVEPKVKDYTVKDNLSNVYQYKRFQFTKDQKQALAKNAFVVVPGSNLEFFQVYEMNRYDNIPSFITTDSVLHTYHLLFDTLLKDMEEFKFNKILVDLSDKMLKDSQSQYSTYQAAGQTDFAQAAKRNMAFFAVGARLLNAKAKVPAEVKDVVEADLKLVNGAKGISPSPLTKMVSEQNVDPILEDYSQYKPRGHYTKSTTLKKYFKAMMWYGRITFRQKSSSETISALLMTDLLQKDPKNWQLIYEPTAFLVGQADDLSYFEYYEVVKEAYGENYSASDLVDPTKLAAYQARVKELRPPQINSMVLMDPEVEENSKEEETMGFRFMGQRYTLDANIFQQLMYREMQATTQGEKRMLPRSLDVANVFGSDLAKDIVTKEGKECYAGPYCYGGTDYPNFTEKEGLLKTQVKDMSMDEWSQTVYSAWLYDLKPLAVNQYKNGYPLFMTNQAWQKKDLNAFQGSYTELKHDTILYAKQAYAELGAAVMENVRLDDRGYVEPNLDVYLRLKALIDMTKSGLEQRNLLSYSGQRQIKHPMDPNQTITLKASGKDMAKTLDQLATTVNKLVTISEKELQAKDLTDVEYEFIRTFGGKLEHVWAVATGQAGLEGEYEMEDNEAPVVADVATDPNGYVLELGTGYIYQIYVVVPGPQNRLKLARGGVYSQYEFVHPLSSRLTDKEWLAMVKKNKTPDLKKWKEEFIKSGQVKVKSGPDKMGSYDTLAIFTQNCTSQGGKVKENFDECSHLKTKDCEKKATACLYY